ncbi:MAG: hypothetical protein WA667_06995 [Candidatus Nitrosopolaris sp.]
MRRQEKYNIKKYIDEMLPEEYEKSLVGVTVFLKEACTAAQQTKR